jgi:CO/xanthine dehydrogenase Mo-binding subunit
VKWIEDRRENFFATTQERGQIHDAEFAFDADGRILGVHDVFLHDAGAYAPYPLTIPITSSCTLLGPYRVPNYYSEFRAVFTNLPIVTPYRGAGRQHGVFVMERMLDLAARELGLDPAEIRRRNLLTPDEFPHDHEIIFQDFRPLRYDSGNYEPALDAALEAVGYREFREKRQVDPGTPLAGSDEGQASTSNGVQAGGGDPDAAQRGKGRTERTGEGAPAGVRPPDGRRRGIGIVCYVEGTGIGPYEGARVTVEPSGRVNVATGIGTQGQGHMTTFAQIVADELGVDPAGVRVVTGDTREFGWGTGTFASRGAVVAGNACSGAAKAVREKVLVLAAEQLEVAAEDLVLEGGRVFAQGAPQVGMSLGELAVKANPLRGAVRHGTEPGLEATSYFGPESGSTASGVHAMIVAVDPETFLVQIERYVVVHDCGRVINPMILDGQIVGGVAQGIGNAFYERLAFDEHGQLMSASLMDYLLPTATDVPRIETHHIETPSPLNPLGIKGAGEAGAIPVAALFAQAVEDALGLDGFELLEIPLSPNRLFELVTAHRAAPPGAEDHR